MTAVTAPAAGAFAPVREHSVSSTAHVTQTLEHIELETNLVVFRLTYAVVMDGHVPPSLAARSGTHTLEGFARPGTIEQFVAGKVPSIETVNLRLAKPDWLSLAQRLGYMPAFEAAEKSGGAWQDNVFEAFRTNQANIDDLAIDDLSAHMLFDRHGGVLPIGLHFSYLSGGMHDGVFDLQRALPLLVANEQVHATDGRGRPTELRVEPIPYYNQDAERTAQINFVFSPSAEQMRTLWKKAKAMRRQYPSTVLHEAVHELDLLGLRAGGACRDKRENGDA